jgi:phosphatidylserine decarboxylase
VTPRSPHAVDIRRRAGWLPDDQDDLESWIAGHRERVDARGDDVELHPVLVEFQELIDTDPLVRMYMHQMISQVPTTKQYSKRHLESVPQMLRLINEVLTMAPEFSEDSRCHRASHHQSGGRTVAPLNAPSRLN